MTTEEYEAVCGVVAEMLRAEREKASALEARVRVLESRPEGKSAAIPGALFKDLAKTVREFVYLKTAPLVARLDALEATLKAKP